MARQSVLTHSITDPYSDLEAWMYDTFFAPAMLGMVREEIETAGGDLPTGGEILDVGCGGGHIPLAMLEMRSDVRASGVDLSPKQIARAQRRAKQQHLEDRAHFEVATALDLPFVDSRFDAVLSVTSIKHWSSRKKGLIECLRVLKPNGLLLVVEVDRGCRLDALKRFLATSRAPRFLLPMALPFLRTFIFGQGLDLDELRHYRDELPIRDSRVARIAGMPALVLTGRLGSVTGRDAVPLREVG